VTDPVETLVPPSMTANGMARPCSRPRWRKPCGSSNAKEHVPCPTSAPTTITTIGIDLGKNTFHLVGFDKRGAIVLQLKLSRGQIERRLANVPPCLIGMEACSGSHHIGRRLTALGHDVRLIPAQYVKPFLKGHKNDYRDAEAIAEAVQRPTMRFVAIKTPEQMDLLALHRVRSRLVGQRTGLINQLRGFLIERGITVRQGVMPLRKALPDILSSNTGTLSPRVVRLIADLMQDWRRLDERIATVSAEIEALAQQDESCQRLITVPGVGPIISSAVVAAIGNGSGFKQGRDFGAWLGLVPKQESTGDRTILGKISKRGNKYLRTLFVQAAHVVLARRPAAAKRGLWPWIEQASRRLHRNMLAIALANKLARIAWAVLARGRAYEPRVPAHA
jgi:transposase